MGWVNLHVGLGQVEIFPRLLGWVMAFRRQVSETKPFYLSSILSVKYSLSYSMSTRVIKLECGPMPNVMAALPNIGGTLCSTPQSLADAHY